MGNHFDRKIAQACGIFSEFHSKLLLQKTCLRFTCCTVAKITHEFIKYLKLDFLSSNHDHENISCRANRVTRPPENK